VLAVILAAPILSACACSPTSRAAPTTTIPGRSIALGRGPNDSRERAVFAVMSKFFAWCVDQKRRLIKVSPMSGLTRPGVADARERVLNDDEVRWFWAACDELGTPSARCSSSYC
jgi:hypothetical protein